jgi:diadenosine tetraphosphatase ApaH/serine/threonine PP2A family protein phosphatase
MISRSSSAEVTNHCLHLLTVLFPSEIPHEGPLADLVWSDPDPDKEEFAISPRWVAWH